MERRRVEREENCRKSYHYFFDILVDATNASAIERQRLALRRMLLHKCAVENLKVNNDRRNTTYSGQLSFGTSSLRHKSILDR